MFFEHNGKKIELSIGDIVEEKADAIVNAANSSLRIGGGVDGAIHSAAGPSVRKEQEEKYPHGCATGEAVITTGGDLQAKHIIHTVGPVYRQRTEDAYLLEQSHQRSLELAEMNDCESVVFPAISCGVYGYPVSAASNIALQSAHNFLQESKVVKRIRFVLYDEAVYNIFVMNFQELVKRVKGRE